MHRRDIVVLIGLLAVAACIDRKSEFLDGATSDDGPGVEVVVLPGTGGAPGVDSATGIDLGQVVDGPADPDVPITTPDAGPIDVSAGSGGVTGTGGIGGTMDAGAGGTAGADGATVNLDAPPAQLPSGSPCAVGTVCASGICADGVCCGSACSGCNACARSLTGQPDGICAPVSSGADPHNTCADETASNQCGNDGACDGSAACRKVATSHLCAAATCAGSTFTPASFCDGKGACAVSAAQSCPAGQSCSGNTCACVSPNLTCGGSCVNAQTDASHCGACSHSCGTGGTCTSGKCQPITLLSGLPGYSFVFGVDASYVYYSHCTSFYDCTPKRIAINGGTATTLMDTVYVSGIGVMGNVLFLFQNRVASFLCATGSTCAVSSSTRVPDGMYAGFKNGPSYLPVNTYSNSTTEITTWYDTSSATFTVYGSPHYWTYDCAGGVGRFMVAGTYQYWSCGNGSGSYTIWRTNGSIPSTSISQITGAFTFSPNPLDANSQSLIFQDSNTKNLYRVPIPGGLGAGAPQLIVSGTGTNFVTEDSNGIYWIDTLSNLNRCSASSCSSTTTVMTTGQTVGEYYNANTLLSVLHQDSGFLYWINGAGQLLKLAK